MTPTWFYVLGALGLGGVVSAGIAYWGSRRTSSGRIDTTEAARLWDESDLMRRELRDEVVALRKQVDSQAGKIDLLVQQNETLREKHEDCQRSEALLSKRLEDLENSVERRRKRS